MLELKPTIYVSRINGTVGVKPDYNKLIPMDANYFSITIDRKYLRDFSRIFIAHKGKYTPKWKLRQIVKRIYGK